MGILTRGLIAAVFIAVGQLASAATILPTAQTPQIAGNDKVSGGSPDVATTLAAFDTLLSPYFDPGFSIYQIAKYDVDDNDYEGVGLSVTLDDSKKGSWTYTGGDTPYVVVYKGGPGWIGQYFAGGITGNMFDVANLNGVALSNGNNVPGLSHLTLYGVEGNEVSTVPLPAGGLLLLVGIGALGFARRRKT
ncbi:VPLPA-CTERM protein sorting domain-containing protein [Cognatiyoonia koreensis]|uniref:VPLPA-CTERM protein sorting domain-containing protein n=1 Tax=Cognatiyoonia koreensis TaxID=364200 RepID=A0A1I0NTL1_9RHOB|nr:VPLPA-CTERM sorting domain-containing protein [Cognatiyoonia koreensis]SEW05026.1 VPLPA-CTERM protein sorting domain-containing protein [Cognatiyoonia koreensis]